MVRNVTWLSIQEVLLRIIGLATAIYLARMLTPTAYGALGVALAIVGILSNLVHAGTGSRATRLTALDPDSVPLIYAQMTGLRLVMAVFVIACLVLLAPALSRTFSISATLLILCSLLLLRPALTVVWAFRGLDKMHVNAVADVAEKTMAFAGLILLVKGQGNDLLWVPVLEVAAALIMVWWLYRQLGRIYPGLSLEFRYRDWPEISREALPLGLAAILGSVYMNGAILLLGWLYTTEAAADFLVAQKLMLTMAILLHVINKSAFPSTSRLISGNLSQAFDLLGKLLRYYLVIITPVILLLALYADEVLTLLFGGAYSNSGFVLIILLAALPFLAFSRNLQLLLRAIPRAGAILAGRVTSTLVLLLLAALLIPRYAAVGAAVAVVISEAVGMTLLYWLVMRSIGSVPWNHRCFSPLLAGLAATLIFAVTDGWPAQSGLMLSAITYVVVAWMLKAATLDELRTLPYIISTALQKDAPGQDPANNQERTN
jgi:O-antigen/teichoic acid export membrane protein